MPTSTSPGRGPMPGWAGIWMCRALARSGPTGPALHFPLGRRHVGPAPCPCVGTQSARPGCTAREGRTLAAGGCCWPTRAHGPLKWPARSVVRPWKPQSAYAQSCRPCAAVNRSWLRSMCRPTRSAPAKRSTCSACERACRAACSGWPSTRAFPVTVYLTGLQVGNGRRFLRIHQLGVHDDLERLMQDVFAFLDQAIREDPPAWHFWGEADRIFVP